MAKSEVLKKMESVLKGIDRILVDYVDELPFIMQGFIGSNMSNTGVSDNYRTGISDVAIEKLGLNKTDILRNVSGRLASSFTKQTAFNSQDVGTNIIKSGYQIKGDFGSEVVYAAIHNFGGQAGRGKKVTIPKRPYFSDAVKDMNTKLDDDILNVIVPKLIKLAEQA